MRLRALPGDQMQAFVAAGGNRVQITARKG
jgi:hypothetical protein